MGINFKIDTCHLFINELFYLFETITAITIGVRILGPALGFIVGSLCTSLYADLTVDPKIDTTDPRWVGAWWLGKLLYYSLVKT